MPKHFIIIENVNQMSCRARAHFVALEHMDEVQNLAHHYERPIALEL